MRRAIWVVALALWGTSAAAACSSSDSDAESPSDCLIGSERCACTSGGACDPGLTCRSEHCVRLPGSGAGGEAQGPDGGPSGTGGRRPGGGGISGSGGGAPGAGGQVVGAGGQQGGATGGQPGGAGGSAPVVPASCPFPADSVSATESSDPLGQSLDTLDAVFSSGRLVELGGKACTSDTSGAVPTGDWGSWPCRDAYDCDGCLVFVIGPDGANAVGNWFLLGAHSATNGDVAGCAELSASYTMCAPDCAGKQCGDDGCGSLCGSGCGTGRCCNTQDTCVVDTCSECLASCAPSPGVPPIPNCCTGVGCICAGACPGPC